jgi:hypothetical protein
MQIPYKLHSYLIGNKVALVNYGLLRHEKKVKGVPIIGIFTRAARELADSNGCGLLSKQFEGSFKKS